MSKVSKLKDKLKARLDAAETAKKRPAQSKILPAVITRSLAAAISPAGVCPLTLKWRMVTSAMPSTRTALNQLISEVCHSYIPMYACMHS
jgi:hypothetical protein